MKYFLGVQKKMTTHFSAFQSAINAVVGSKAMLPSFIAADDAVHENGITKEYKEQLIFLLEYAAKVKAFDFPVPHDISTWPGGKDVYFSASKTWSQLGGNLQAWAASTLKNVTGLPKSLLDNGKQIVIPSLQAAVDITDLLINDPSNSRNRESLINVLKLLSINFKLFSSQTISLIDNFHNQSTVFDQDAKTISILVGSSLSAAGNSKAKIEEINDKISKLNDDITSHVVSIVLGSIVAVTGVVIGIVAVVLVPFTGGASLALLIPAIAITTGGAAIITLNVKNIVDDKNSIDLLTADLKGHEADIVLLQTMSQSLRMFADKVSLLKGALNVVVKPWEEAEKYFVNAGDTIQHIENASVDDWRKAQKELKEILDSWNNLQNTLEGLQVAAQVAAGVNLTIGMTDAEVQHLLNNTVKVDIIEYLLAAA